MTRRQRDASASGIGCGCTSGCPFMERRFLVAAIALVALAVLAWHREPKEPAYQGKALTQWINEAHDVGIFEQTDETKSAMLAFGTNAVPFLLKEFTRPISHPRDRLKSCAAIRSHCRTTARSPAATRHPWSCPRRSRSSEPGAYAIRSSPSTARLQSTGSFLFRSPSITARSQAAKRAAFSRP